VLLCVRAAVTVDPYWDTLAYHWPFAARLAGICNIDCFNMPAPLEQRYVGFPKLWHWLQGLVWRVTGSPGQADLLNLAMVALLCAYLKRRFAVPLAWSWLAFLAIPEIQIELTASMIDLPLNAALALALLVMLRILVDHDKDNRSDAAIALVALCVAANSKPQLTAIAVLFWITISALVVLRGSHSSHGRRAGLFFALAVSGTVLLTPKWATNTYQFGNPFYPVQIAIGPLSLPGTETMVSSIAMSDAIKEWPGPVRWLASVFEFDAFRGRPLPWTIGQGEVPQSSPSFRMGGYFVAYVLAMIVLLVWFARSNKMACLALGLFAIISILCAWLPLSFESRYYSFWMLTLVATVLAMGHSPVFASTHQLTQRAAVYATVSVALISVLSMTGGAYVRTDGTRLTDLTATTDRVIAQVPDGATLCVLNRAREAILYSSLFHPSRHYRTKVLWGEEADPACTVRVDTATELIIRVQ
jgi:hypothetical protein